MRQRAFSRGWEKWQADYYESKRLQVVSKLRGLWFLQMKQMALAWRAWAAYNKRLHELLHGMNHATTIMGFWWAENGILWLMRRYCSAFFMRWADRTLQAAKIARYLKKGGAKWLRPGEFRAIKAWRVFAKYGGDWAKLMKRAAGNWLGSTVVSGWRFWVLYAEAQRKLKQFDDKLAVKIGLRGWKAWIDQLKAAQKLQRLGINFGPIGKQKRCWDIWRVMVEERARILNLLHHGVVDEQLHIVKHVDQE